MSKESIKSHEDLVVYQMAFEAAMKIFQLSKKFPVEERYSLTDPSGSQSLMGETPKTALSHQIRRSSRSVCANLAEAWRKRRYEAAFIAKLSDCEAEAAETQVWLKFAVKCHDERVPLRLTPTRGRSSIFRCKTGKRTLRNLQSSSRRTSEHD